MTAIAKTEPLFRLDVTKADLAQEFKTSGFDKEFINTRGPAEVDLIVSGLANGGESARNAVQALINTANIPVGALQAGAQLTYNVVSTTLGAVLNTASLATNAVMSLKDGLFYALDANFRDAVKSLSPEGKKAAFIHYAAMKQALHRYASIFGKKDWSMFANGLERMAKGAVLTAKELASMTKNAADAIAEVSVGVAVAVGRPVIAVTAGVTGVFFKAIARICQVMKELFAAGERGADFVGDKSFAVAGRMMDGYQLAPMPQLAAAQG
jgi:heme oxygenase